MINTISVISLCNVCDGCVVMSRPKFGLLQFKIYVTDHNEILHTSRQCNCRDVLVLIGWEHFKLEPCKFSSNFEFDRNIVCGTGAWLGFQLIIPLSQYLCEGIQIIAPWNWSPFLSHVFERNSSVNGGFPSLMTSQAELWCVPCLAGLIVAGNLRYFETIVTSLQWHVMCSCMYHYGFAIILAQTRSKYDFIVAACILFGC